MTEYFKQAFKKTEPMIGYLARSQILQAVMDLENVRMKDEEIEQCDVEKGRGEGKKKKQGENENLQGEMK